MTTQTLTLTFLERQAAAERLWTFVLPTVAVPPNLTWVRWLSASTDKDIEKAITQVPYRFQKGLPKAEEIYRFVSSILSVWRQRRMRQLNEMKAATRGGNDE